jgi:hypothetical protein
MLIFIEEFSNGNGRSVRCLCYCGREFVAKKSALIRGEQRSCGCYRAAALARGNRKHGYRDSPTYRSWKNMKSRCYYEGDKCFAEYGGRGITVCQEWRDNFEAFLRDMGERAAGMTLDRADNDGPYCKENCRWATTKQQNRNRSDTRWIEIGGKRKSLGEWTEIYGVEKNVVQLRINRLGWTPIEALTTPSMGRGHRRGTA